MPVARERQENAARKMSIRRACWAEGACAELEASRESLGFITYKVGAPCPELHGAGVTMANRTQEV